MANDGFEIPGEETLTVPETGLYRTPGGLRQLDRGEGFYAPVRITQAYRRLEPVALDVSAVPPRDPEVVTIYWYRFACGPCRSDWLAPSDSATLSAPSSCWSCGRQYAGRGGKVPPEAAGAREPR